MTLIELLAALMILSSATTAGMWTLRRSTAVIRESQDALDAFAVYDRWRERRISDSDAPIPWQWTDEQDRIWTVSDLPGDPAGALPSARRSNQQAPQSSTDPNALRWRQVTITLDDPRQGRPSVVMTLRGLGITLGQGDRGGAAR